ERHTEIPESGDVLGIQPQRGLKCFAGLASASGTPQDSSKICPNVGIVRIDCEGSANLCFCLGVHAPLMEQHTEVMQSAGVGRSAGEDRLVSVSRLFKTTG